VSPEERYLEAVAPFRHELALRRPGGAHVVDAHTHLGLDEDGMTLDPGGLLAMLDEADAQQAIVFPLHDPERAPGYRVPNDRVLEWAAGSGGRLVPFCRLDPRDGPLAEAERALRAGAQGIKLHPRAQAFDLAGQVEPIFALAERAEVPILIHAGRGLPDTFAAELVEIAQRHPGARLILAHVGVADQAALAAGLRGHPGAVFDTSWLNLADTIGLLAQIPAERLVFGSDPPYGRTYVGLFFVLRIAACLGLPPDAVRLILGGTVQRLLAREELAPAGPPPAPERLVADARLVRLHSSCMMIFGASMAGVPALDILDLAAAICRDPEPGPAGDALERVAPLLGLAREFLPSDRPEVVRMGRQCLVLTAAVASTEVPQQAI